MKIIETLKKSDIPLTSRVILDEFTAISSKAFDYAFDGESKYYPWLLPTKIDKDFKLGVIFGSSGSGKSNLLKEFGNEFIPNWEKDRAIVSHFDDPEEAINKLTAVGLNSIPAWNQPYHTLSTGEKFRADMSRKLFNGSVIDEFSSVIDRNVAKATSMALNRYLKTNNVKNIVLSTCHEDVIEYLEPDWVINTNTGNLYDGFFLTENQSILKYISQTVQRGPCLRTIII